MWVRRSTARLGQTYTRRITNGTRAAVISDIHANLVALEAVLADIDRQAVDEIWCLGDVVGLGPKPTECLEVVRERCDVVLMGNHELHALGRYGGGSHVHVQVVVDSGPFTDRLLGAKDRALLASFPERVQRGPWLLVHDLAAGHLQPAEAYTSGGGRDDPTAESFASVESRLVLTGHTHAPSAFRLVIPESPVLGLDVREPLLVDHTALIANPGSVGLSRWRTPDATYFLLESGERSSGFLEPGEGSGTLTLQTVTYDHDAVLEQSRAAGAPPNVTLSWQLRAGKSAEVRGAIGAAREAYAECLLAYREMGNEAGVLGTLSELTSLAVSAGDAALALLLAGAVRAARQTSGIRLLAPIQKRLDAQVEIARASLGPGAKDAEAAGESLTLAQTIALATGAAATAAAS
jgi:hypothetical protein